MLMDNNYHSGKKRLWLVFPLIIVGSGLIIISVLGFFLSPRLDSTEISAAKSDIPESSIPVTVEFNAPELTIFDLNGAPVSLRDYHGRVILVNNWATWCPPCKSEMPELQAYFDDHKDQEFMIVAIDAGDPSHQVKQFVHEYGLTFDVMADPNMNALTAFRNSSLPSSYVIDESGTVRLAWTGAISREMLEKHLTPLLED